jgi:tRNA(fMet)-specific endonuclease VapC
MRWLLDTNILIAALKLNPAVLAHLETIDPGDLVLSPIVLGELELGVLKSRWSDRNRKRLDALLANVSLAPLDAAVARAYGRIRADLERAEKIIGANDLWIAAQALSLESTLVTDNVGEFERVTGLVVENWLAQ